MANSRNKDPLENLQQVASQLALYLSAYNADELISILSVVKEKYGAPRNSWVWGPIYWLLKARNRLPEIDQVIDALEDTKLDHLLKSQRVIDLFSHDGWEETSFNTNFLRALVKQLPDYDPRYELTKGEINTLKDLLIKAVNQKLLNEEKLNELTIKLLEIEREIGEKKNELEIHKEKLMTLNREFDVSSLTLVEFEELKKFTDMSIKTYLAERQERINKFNDLHLGLQSNRVSNIKKKLNEQNFVFLCEDGSVGELEKIRQKRKDELNALENKRKQGNKDNKELARFKQRLSLLYKNPSIKQEPRLTSLFKEGCHTKVKTTNVEIVENYVGSTSVVPKEASVNAEIKSKDFIKGFHKMNELFKPRLESNIPQPQENKSGVKLGN